MEGCSAMSITVIGINSRQRFSPVPNTAIEHLTSLLKGADADIIINGYGQAWGPSSTQLWDAGTIAEFVNSDPTHVWIDWCGWPGYWQINADGTVVQQGPQGWANLSADLGYKWLAKSNFVVPQNFFQNPFAERYPMVRGWDLTPSQNGVYYQYAVGGYAQLADLHHGDTMGHYVYAAANETNLFNFSFTGTADMWANSQAVADFVSRVLAISAARRSGSEPSRVGISHGGSYNVSTPAPVAPTGSSSPYHPTTSTGRTSYKPSPPSPTFNVTTALEVAGAGAVVGAAGYLIAKSVQKGRA